VSEQNVDLVRKIHELWSQGDPDLIDPELEYVNPEYAVEAGTRRGRRTLWKIREVYPDFRLEPERFVDAGEDVVVIGEARDTTASGVKAQWREGYVWTAREGEAVRFRWFSRPAEALGAVGLSE
jgi:ketosteroid isomerase-like protein